MHTWLTDWLTDCLTDLLIYLVIFAYGTSSVCCRLYEWRAVVWWVVADVRRWEHRQFGGWVFSTKSARSTRLWVESLRTSSRHDMPSRLVVRRPMEIRRVPVSLANYTCWRNKTRNNEHRKSKRRHVQRVDTTCWVSMMFLKGILCDSNGCRRFFWPQWGHELS